MWIEIIYGDNATGKTTVSLPAWGVWIEISHERQCHAISGRSLPAWGVWIEMFSSFSPSIMVPVAPRMGSVD